MQAVYCEGNAIRVRSDLPVPEPAAGEVRLRVLLAGICDTDLHLARGYMGFRGILGHEFVAIDDSGRRVTAEINNACEQCDTCRAGWDRHCPRRTVLGILGHDGAMAQWVCVPRRNLHVIPDTVTDEAAVFVEPLAAAFRIPEHVEIGRQDRVAFLGDGKLGLLCAWVLRHRGAQVTLIGKHARKLQLAGPGIVTCLLDERQPLGRFDLVVEATGSPTGLTTALELVRPLGTVVLKTTMAEPTPMLLAPLVIDEVRVIGSRCGPFPPAIEALALGSIDVRPLIQAEYPLREAEMAFRAAEARGATKVLLRMPVDD